MILALGRHMKSIKLVTINDCVVFLEFFKKNCNICVLGAVSNPEDFEKFAVKNGPGSFSCSLCTKHAAQLTDIKRHIESIHFPNTFTYACPFCSKQLGSNNAYLVHKKKCIHKY